VKKTKKCGKCKAVMKTHVEYNGKKYNTQNRVYCFDCSPPKNVALDVASNVSLSAALQNKAESKPTGGESKQPCFIVGPLAGEPRWIHGVDDLEERLPNCYKFCQECNLAYTYSIEMVKEKIFKRGTTIPEHVIRYCEDCYEKVSAKILAEKISKHIRCDHCRRSRYTYIAYDKVKKCRVTNIKESYHILCLSCEDDYMNNYDTLIEDEIDDNPVEI
jgi:hypothetical protein